ncbi:hypothetical protein ACIHAR_24225 [Streptomyces sp. NPDC052016]|jgi:hypothetical protein|uniref:hypothetical protein n=1 Tax=unclassified Streptomyces TaxID=2593676 RepID=UPI00342F3A2E
MSETKKDAVSTPQENTAPTAPAKDETITTLDNHMPSEPAGENIIALDNHMPAPPALDLDGK